MAPDDQPGPDEDPLFGEDAREGEHDRGLRGFVPDFVRKMAVAGLGAVFMTEEGIRSLATQLKLPREALTFIIGQAERSKDEVGRVISEEIRRFLQSDRLRDELLKMLAGMTIEVRAEVKLVPDRVKGASDTPSLMPKISVTELKTSSSDGKKKKAE